MGPDYPDIAIRGGEELLCTEVGEPEGSSWTSSTASEKNVRNRARTRLGLPITLNTIGGPATVMACADTGAEENIISYDLAIALGLGPSYVGPRKEFMLANGKVVEALGQISVLCSFGVETNAMAESMRCVFHVFLQLASPIIMGMAFLDETETMTTYRERLVRIQRPNMQALQVYSLGRPRKELLCYLNGHLTQATPDSGSDLDIMTPRFAQERGFQIQRHEEVIEFADGSIALTCGSVQVELAVSHPGDWSGGATKIPDLKVFLLDQFAHDILIGIDSIEELEIFTKNYQALIAVSDSTGPLGLHHIRSRGVLDKVKSWVKKKINIFRKNRDSSEGLTCNVVSSCGIDDQRENHRRDREEARIATLPLDQQDVAIEAEAQRQIDYESSQAQAIAPTLRNLTTPHLSHISTDILPAPPIPSFSEPAALFPHMNCSNISISNLSPIELTSAVDDEQNSDYLSDAYSPVNPYIAERNLSSTTVHDAYFKCDHPGCTAPPFQTQYLPNSHLNIHSQSRPHYCPVQGCPRAEGGKGFKRKNEMIRHGLVHTSPGYVCPSCPDREHKYPRPDNLQRHVRVHHVDKTADDPLLLAVFAQRPEGGSHGRRRRAD